MMKLVKAAFGAAALSIVSLDAAAEPLRFVVFGDLQDETPAGRATDRTLIDDINAVAPAFSVFIGDIKGGGLCTDALNSEMRAIFDTHRSPLIYTPGDNEWTDCWQERMGAVDPTERKEAVIALFTADGESIGRTAMPLQQQDGQRENARWTAADVMFATFHVTGSNNNFRQDREAVAEHFARSDRNLTWLRETFQAAGEADAAAIALFIHGNPQWDAQPWAPTGFDRFRATLAEEANRFEGPILIFHGDTHTFRIDRPFEPVPHLTRLEVFGPPDRGAVIVKVDASIPELFSFSTITAENE